MATVSPAAKEVNGVNVEKLQDIIAAIVVNPALAQFTFRASTSWRSGGHSNTTMQSFYGAGREDQSRARALVIESDEPPVLLGNNRGPNAVELVLAALAACLAVGMAYTAAAEGIRLQSMEFSAEGSLDLQGFLGLSTSVRPGLHSLQLECRVASDAPAAQIARLFERVKRSSPLVDIICNPVPLTLEFTTIAASESY